MDFSVMEIVQKCAHEVEELIETVCEGKPAWKIVCYSVAATVAISWIRNFLDDNESLKTRTKLYIFRLSRKIPFIKRKIEKDVGLISKTLENQMKTAVNNDSYITKLPLKGWSKDKITEEAIRYSKYGSANWKKGYVSGAVYSGEDELTNLMTDVYGLSLWTNPLHTDVFPGVRKMEAEVIRMCCDLFHGGENSCGTMTTGGTESIFLACKAFRDYAIKVKGIKRPEILVPITAHAAFDKAAHLLNIPIRHAPLDPNTMKVDVKAMEKMINRRTCMIVGSAPQFPQGTVDPIENLSDLALKYDIPLHVDACLGGFLIAFMDDAGYPLPLFDFRVDGVKSISCDTHKYGFSPKGSSVIMYKDFKYRHYQFFVQTDWPGGIYATPTLAGSRPGGILAATWASLIYHGREEYVKITKDIISVAKKIEEGCSKIPGLFIVGKPEVSVVAVGSKVFNIYILSDRMKDKGWNLNILQFPSCIHIAVTVPHTKEGVSERFLSDLEEISKDLIENPPQEVGGDAAIYGLAQSLPDRTIVEDVAKAYLDACYITE